MGLGNLGLGFEGIEFQFVVENHGFGNVGIRDLGGEERERGRSWWSLR